MEILLFTASWCAPCQSVKKWIDKYPFVTLIDADEEAATADMYGVRSLPTFIKRENGETVDFRHGAMSEREFGKWVE